MNISNTFGQKEEWPSKHRVATFLQQLLSVTGEQHGRLKGASARRGAKKDPGVQRTWPPKKTPTDTGQVSKENQGKGPRIYKLLWSDLHHQHYFNINTKISHCILLWKGTKKNSSIALERRNSDRGSMLSLGLQSP